MGNAGLGIQPATRPEVRVRMGLKPSVYRALLQGRAQQLEAEQPQQAAHLRQLAQSVRDGIPPATRTRFWLARGRADGKGQNAISELHPSFADFNRVDLPAAACAELRGNLIHADWVAPTRHGAGCCWTRFSADKLPGHGTPPGMHPVCSGDGHTRRRWVQGRWQEGHCPGDACEFRQNDNPPCKRSSTLVFQLRWLEQAGRRPLPSTSAFIESAGSWGHTTHQWWGFYVQIRRQWRHMFPTPCTCQPSARARCKLCEGDGLVGDPDLYGLPIRLSLAKYTVPGNQFWVPELFTDFSPGQTLQGFLAARAQLLEQARPLLASAAAPLALPGAVLGARGTAEAAYMDVDADPVEPPVRGGR